MPLSGTAPRQAEPLARAKARKLAQRPGRLEATLLRDQLGNPPGAISRGCHDQAFWPAD